MHAKVLLMTRNQFIEFLKYNDACPESIKWIAATNGSPKQLIEKCNDADYMYFLYSVIADVIYYLDFDEDSDKRKIHDSLYVKWKIFLDEKAQYLFEVQEYAKLYAKQSGTYYSFHIEDCYSSLLEKAFILDNWNYIKTLLYVAYKNPDSY